jgi:hypothetical protein
MITLIEGHWTRMFTILMALVTTDTFSRPVRFLAISAVVVPESRMMVSEFPIRLAAFFPILAFSG